MWKEFYGKKLAVFNDVLDLLVVLVKIKTRNYFRGVFSTYISMGKT